MIIIGVVILAIFGLAAPNAYVIDTVPVGFLPVYNSPYRGREIQLQPQRPNNSLNVANREVAFGCMPFEYDLPGSHSGFYGCRKNVDKLLFTENIFKPKRFLSSREKFIDYPGELPAGHVREDVISAIWCYDVRGYGKGGYCSIMDGGIGKKYVRMHIYHTERNVPLRFKIEIYGHTNSTNNATRRWN